MNQTIKAPPEVAPFRAWRYALSKAKTDMANLVCPPYDVINEATFDSFAARSPSNAIHLILPEKGKINEVKKGTYLYQQQKTLWESLREEGVVEQDVQPALYICEESFEHPFAPGQTYRRLGIIALKRLADFESGKVKPHENTLLGPKSDRLNLMRALKSNMSPIFGLFSDPEKKIGALLADFLGKTPPVYDFSLIEPEPATHKLWVLEDSAIINPLCELLSGTLFIADGHHRYETALNYVRELGREQEVGPNSAANYMPILLVALEDPGLLVLPTHRLVHGMANFHPKLFLERLKQNVKVEVMKRDRINHETLQELLGNDSDKKGTIRLALKFAKDLAEAPDDLYVLTVDSDYKRLSPLHELGVVYLQEEIFAKELGIDAQALAQERFVKYTRDAEEAALALERGDAQAAFFVQSPTASQVSSVCEAGLRMPQKSTFFYPKVPTGLVFRTIDPKETVS